MATGTSFGVARWTWLSTPPGVAIRPAPNRTRGVRADDEVDAVHDVRVTGPADACDDPVFDPYVPLENAQDRIDDYDTGDHGVELAVSRAAMRHHHAGPYILAPAVEQLISVCRVIALHLHNQVRVAQPDAVSGCRAVQVRVGLTINLKTHYSASR